MENLTRTERVSELERQLREGEQLLKERKHIVWAKFSLSQTSRGSLSEHLAEDFTYCAIQEKMDRIKVQIQELWAEIIAFGNIETL